MESIQDAIQSTLVIDSGNSGVNTLINMLIISTVVPLITELIKSVMDLIKKVWDKIYEKIDGWINKWYEKDESIIRVYYKLREGDFVGRETRQIYQTLLKYVCKHGSQKVSEAYQSYHDDSIIRLPEGDITIGEITYHLDKEIISDAKLDENQTLTISSETLTEKQLHDHINEIYNADRERNKVTYPYIIVNEMRYTDKSSVVKLYRNTNTMTVDDIYINDKSYIFNAIDEYEKHRTGMLNIMLHGPPGTGKTSFIKALSKYTGRDIRICNLGDIDSIVDLREWLFSQKQQVILVESNENSRIQFINKLLIFEDFDANTDVCNRRAKIEQVEKSKKSTNDDAPALIEVDDGINYFSSDDDDYSDDDSNKKPVRPENPLNKLLSELEKKNKEDNTMADDIAKLTTMAQKLLGADSSGATAVTDYYKYKSKYDLRLSDILNAFDGILVPNNIICIFTTNCIDKIDEAFLRDGRMHLNVRLGAMKADVLEKFIVDKYNVSPSVCKSLCKKLDEKLTLAVVTSAYKANKNSYEDFVIALKQRV